MSKRVYLPILWTASTCYFCIRDRSDLISNGSLHQFVTHFLGEKTPTIPENMSEETHKPPISQGQLQK